MKSKKIWMYMHLKIGALFLLLWLPFAQAQPHIQKSPLDDRHYAYSVLPNGLQVVAVSDPQAQTNGVAMVVKAGSFDDPQDFPGLAHFLEHMLFLGTKKYPIPDEFQAVLSANGGTYNATTAGEHTSFFFNVQPTVLPSILDRFADFFVAPLLSPELMERELKAVDAEFQMHQGQDGAGLVEVYKETSNPLHPYSRFTSGNLQTLGSNKPLCLAALRQFYTHYYQAEKMTLALVGPQPLPELLTLAQKHFSHLPSQVTKTPERPWPFTVEQLGTDIAIKSKGDYRSLILHFPLLNKPSEQQRKTGELISFLLGDEGKGSLLSALKKQKWVTGLNTSFEEITSEQDELTVHFSLTPDGLKNIDQITDYTFSYLKLLRNKGVPNHVVEELKQMSQWHFLYMERAEPLNFALYLASQLQEYPPERLLNHAYWLPDTKISQEHFVQIMDQLTPQQMRRVIIHPNNQGQKQSKWYAYDYSTKKIPVEKLQAFSQVGLLSELQLPTKNPYIPTKLELAKSQQADDLPKKLPLKGITLWHHQDTKFQKPKADIIVNVTSPLAAKQPENALLNSLYAELVLDDLREELYPISKAGASIQVHPHAQGLAVIISGYSDKQADILDKVFRKMRTYQVAPEQFALFKEKMIRGLKNYQQLPLYEKAFNDLNVLLFSPSWHQDDLLKASTATTTTGLSQYVAKFWQTGKIEMLINGNYNAEQALKLGQTVANSALHQEGQAAQRLKIAKLHKKSTWVKPLPADDQNQVMVWYLQNHQADLSTMAKTLLLGKILEVPFFQQLRTEQQLGYALNANAYLTNKISGLVFWIQSPKNQPNELLSKVRQFLQDVRPQIEQLTDEQLASYRHALIQQLREPPRSLSEQSTQWWRVIERGEDMFDRPEQLAKIVEKMTAKELVAFALPLLKASPDAGQVMVLSTPKGTLPAPNVVAEGKIASVEAFKNEAEFVAG